MAQEGFKPVKIGMRLLAPPPLEYRGRQIELSWQATTYIVQLSAFLINYDVQNHPTA